jgi:hypothetical protein
LACPISSLLVLGTTVGGARTLLVDDRRYRTWTWLLLAATVAAWILYFLYRREPELRIALEVGTVIFLGAAIGRAVWLRRRARAGRPATVSALRAAWQWTASPWVLAIKGWIAAMVVMEAFGRVHFTVLEWMLVSAALAAAIAITVMRRRRRPFATLESLAAGSCAPGCPLGFGDAQTGARAVARANDGSEAFGDPS